MAASKRKAAETAPEEQAQPETAVVSSMGATESPKPKKVEVVKLPNGTTVEKR